MPEGQFEFMREVLGAPSPIGMEGAMTLGVLEPYIRDFLPDGWTLHHFRGNAGLVVDSGSTGDGGLSVMIIGHADKIRLQVRSIGKDGKILFATSGINLRGIDQVIEKALQGS